MKGMRRLLWQMPVFLLTGAVFFALSRYNYVLFHVTLEFFIVLIGILIFTVSTLSKRFAQTSFLTRLGPGILVSSMITFLHLATYKGMNLIPGYDANLPTQLWVILNVIFSASLLLAMLNRRGRIPDRWMVLLYMTVGITAVVLSFARRFPTCFVVGVGLTPFKRFAEYGIILMLLGTLLLLDRWKRGNEERLRRDMFAVLLLFVLSEFMFTLYSDVYGLANFTGHYLRLVAFFLIYLSIVVEGIQKPYGTIFAELNALSITDSLTRLFNHRHLLECIERFRMQSLNTGSGFYLFVFDIDHFKDINDRFGHTTGDEVLKGVADILAKNVRSSDIACRQGGDEFSILLHDTSALSARAIVDRIHEELRTASFSKEGILLTISGGVVRYCGESTQELLTKADHLLYTAKKDGRNRVYFSPEPARTDAGA